MEIKELIVYTSKLEEQKAFYSRKLGLPVLQEDNQSFSLAIGQSKLVFCFREKVTPYHFAINIPSNQAVEALAWLRKRVRILKDDDNELVDFIDWNAESMYFYDEEQNIVELIARKNLEIKNIDDFNYHAFLSISEVGAPVSNIESAYEQLPSLRIYDGDFTRFCAVGDEKGLFILVNKTLKKWFPINDTAYSSDFFIVFESEGKLHRFLFQNEKFMPAQSS